RGPPAKSPDHPQYARPSRLRNHGGRKRRAGADGNRKPAAGSHFDGYPIADHGRLHRHEPNQSRSCFAVDPDHRGHLLCAQRGRRRRRERRAAMITCQSPSAHVNYWRKSGNTCPDVPLAISFWLLFFLRAVVRSSFRTLAMELPTLSTARFNSSCVTPKCFIQYLTSLSFVIVILLRLGLTLLLRLLRTRFSQLRVNSIRPPRQPEHTAR